MVLHPAMGVRVCGSELSIPGELKSMQFFHDYPYTSIHTHTHPYISTHVHTHPYTYTSRCGAQLNNYSWAQELTKVTDSYHSHASSIFHIGDVVSQEKEYIVLNCGKKGARWTWSTPLAWQWCVKYRAWATRKLTSTLALTISLSLQYRRLSLQLSAHRSHRYHLIPNSSSAQ